MFQAKIVIGGYCGGLPTEEPFQIGDMPRVLAMHVVCACMYEYVQVCIYVCMYVCMYACMYIYVCMDVCIYVCNVCMYV